MRKKKKRNPIKTKAAKTWKLQSEYSRRKFADKNGYVKCITCGDVHLWNSGTLHAGHYIHAGSRRREMNAVSYDDRNINPQCFSCNHYDKDNAKHKYSHYMRNKYGPEIDDELRAIKCQSNLKEEDFDGITLSLKEKLAKLDGGMK